MPPATLYAKIKARVLFRNIRVLFKTPGFTKHVAACPICHAGGAVFEFQNKYMPLDRCLQCGHVYSRKLPKKRILNLLYGDFNYWVQDKVHQGITELRPSEQWNGFIQARMGILEKAVTFNGQSLNVFEIGCSEGMLLHALKERGHQVLGCEMNSAIAEQGRAQLGVDIRDTMFESMDLPKNYYDVVMSFHTLEHVQSPHVVFKRVAEVLKPDGVVVIEVPCGPEEYDNTDHLHFFCEESLRRLILDHFEEAELIENSYSRKGVLVIGSLYGIGRRPKRVG